MGKAIVFGHTKGGVGKSTLSLNITDSIAAAGLSVVLVDIDKMRGNTKLRTLFGNGNFQFEVIDRSDSKTITADLRALKQQHAFVIVDCPPSKDSDAMSAACLAADLLLVPYRPSAMDYIELTEMAPFLVAAQAANSALRGASVANLVDTPPTVLAEQIMATARSLASLPSLGPHVSRRAFFQNAQAEARGVASSKARSASDAKAVEEIDAVMNALLDILAKNP